MTAAEPEEQWKQMKTLLQEITAEVVGFSTRKGQDWLDEAGKALKTVIDPIRSKPIYTFPAKVLCNRQRNHSLALVTAFRRPLHRPTHCTGTITGQDSPSGYKAGA